MLPRVTRRLKTPPSDAAVGLPRSCAIFGPAHDGEDELKQRWREDAPVIG
jgi:hypothetical protein